MNSEEDFEILENDILESLQINLLGLLKTTHAFIPLIRNGQAKKVITLSSGMADIDLINATEIAFATPYAISKAAANVAIAKYNALYNKDGILFLSISPGYVSTERNLGMCQLHWEIVLVVYTNSSPKTHHRRMQIKLVS
jgi:NAD(P)-dependent dehydrogenase (short-subunit alcohol dehydrogenase family)